jgi:hypothetical protein
MTPLENAEDDMLRDVEWDESGVVAAGKDLDGVTMELSEFLADLWTARKVG